MDDPFTEDANIPALTPEAQSESAQPAITGHADIDRALAGLHLCDDVHKHHDALLGAVAVVQQALNPASRSPRPQ